MLTNVGETRQTRSGKTLGERTQGSRWGPPDITNGTWHEGVLGGEEGPTDGARAKQDDADWIRGTRRTIVARVDSDGIDAVLTAWTCIGVPVEALVGLASVAPVLNGSEGHRGESI